MELERKVEDDLARWWARPSRQPLLLLGARQVGKTFTAQRFGQRHFASSVTVNFQTDLDRLRTVFERRLDPRTIMDDLGYLAGTRITPETLLIMDEIQLCPAALTSLKYFAEQAPQHPIIATGSLFEVSVRRESPYTFPVGKVDIVGMFPLDFEEFLWALGHRHAADGIRASVRGRTPFAAHDDATRWLRQYLMTGGLPRPVLDFAQTGDWDEVRRVQRDLAATYVADMALYADRSDAVRTRMIWESVPHQLARDTNRKFLLSELKSGARFGQYETSFAWLEAAGLVYRHHQTEEPVAPLRPRGGGTFFKAFLFDVGILAARLGVVPQVFCSEAGYPQISSAFRGGIVENYVKQALVAAGVESQYWSSGNQAEVDFLLVDEAMNVVPMEVKSSDNVRSRSLDSYRARYQPVHSIRLSGKNVGADGQLLALPLYSAFCVPDVLA